MKFAQISLKSFHINYIKLNKIPIEQVPMKRSWLSSACVVTHVDHAGKLSTGMVITWISLTKQHLPRPFPCFTRHVKPFVAASCYHQLMAQLSHVRGLQTSDNVVGYILAPQPQPIRSWPPCAIGNLSEVWDETRVPVVDIAG